MKRTLSYFFLCFSSVLVIIGQGPTHIQDCKKFTSCAVEDKSWSRPNRVKVYGKRVYSEFIKCSTNTNTGGQEETCINNDPLDACKKTDCSYTCDQDMSSRKKEITGVTSSFEDCDGVVHVGGYDCQTCRPSPTPPPNAGACGGVADWTSYPSSGCSSGLSLVDSWCDLSLTEQGYCNGPSYYDYDSCTCPDGSAAPAPTPPPECVYEQEERSWDPSGYGELQCELCLDGRNNDCSYGR